MASVARKDAKRFSSLNLGTTYKGAKPESKGAGNKGGFQSLGKIQGKRMPGPAQLPSLRKENAGNDPNINLVPQTGGGWGAGKEDEIELSSQSSSQQPVTQAQETQPATQESTTTRETSVKKEGIWATPETNSVGPANLPPPTQQFKKNFPSLEEREARGTKRTIGNEGHHDSTPVVPFTEMDNTSNVTVAMQAGHYHYAHRPRAPYPAGPSHMGPYLPRGIPPFRHGVPPPTGAEYNHYGHRGASFHGYPPQQQPGLPPNSATGGQYQYPMAKFPLHPNSSLAHNMDPYHDGQSKLVKSEELKNLELPDEDDDVGGWAGYHEEVDYSKKVVFDDSGDDEERENHHERQPKRKEIHERESTNRETRMQEAPPLTTEQPHPLHAEQASKHLHTSPADLQYFQQQHIPISGSHYPLYYHPQRAYPITVASRPVDKERPHPIPPQSDLQPMWQQHRRPKGVPAPESAWGEDKLVNPPTVTQPSTVHSIPNEQLESLQQQLEHTRLSDSDSNATTATASAAISAEKKHVTFHIEQQQQPAAPPATRQPLKIMMRDMKVSTRDEHDPPPAIDVFHHSNTGKPPYLQRPNDPDHQHVTNTDKSLPQQQRVSPWKAADRGPITTPRTLYEPEGDKSAKKFNALIKQTSSERGKRSSVSDTAQDGGEQVQSPSGDIKILKAEEKQSKGKHQVTATTPTDETANAHNKSQQSSGGKSKTTEASSSTTTKKGSKRERPSFRQYQPPPAREQQDEQQAYSEGKGSGRRQSRQDYNNEQQQGDSRGQRRKDRQQPEGKYHTEGKDRRHLSDSKHQTEGKPQSEGKHHPEGKHQHVDSNRRENRSRREREVSKEPPSQEQTEQLTATAAADAFKEDISKPEQSQDDKTKQSGKEPQSKGGNSGGETKHRKKSSTSGSAAHKSETSVPKEKSRSRGSRNRGSNNDDWYYSEEYYNQWYGGGYDYYYDYHYDDYNYYPDQRRLPSGRQKQQPYDGSSKNTSERKDNGGKRSQHHGDRGSNRPARTRGGDRKDESSDDKGQQHRSTKDKSREVSEEVPRSKPAEEADTRERNRRRDNKQHVDSNVDKKRSSRTSSGKGNASQSTASYSKSSASHDPTGRSRVTSGKTTSITQDRLLQSDDHSHTAIISDSSSSKKEPTIKDKAASAKMANVDINSPTVFVIDEEQTVPSSSTVTESDDFIRVTSKKEKREMKELEKHRQQEKQRKAEEEENKKKHHSTRKSSHKTKHQHQLQEQSLAQEDQSLSSWSTTSNTSATTVTTASIWTESFTDLLNEGVNQTTYMAAAHSSLMPSGDYQLFPSYSTSSVPLAHLSAAVDSSVVHDLPTTASQGHSLSETDVKPSGVGRPDTSSAGHGAIRTDLPLSKSHSSASVGGAIGRGRGSSSSRAPGSNRGTSSKDSKRLPASSSDSKVSATTSPKISKPSTAVRSKPSTTVLTSSDKVTSVSPAMAATTTTATRGKKITAQVTRATQDGSSKRAGGHSARSGHEKNIKHRSSKLSSTQRQQQSIQQQPHPVPAQPRPVSAQPHALSSSTTGNTVSYASAVKSSPSQDKKCSTVNKPVAYVKPTASTAANLVDEQQEHTTTVVTDVESLSRLPSFPTAHLSQEILAEEDAAVILTSAVEQVKPVKVTSNEPLAASYVSPIVTKSPSPVTATASNRLSSFVPFTFVASPSPSSVVITQVTTVTPTVTTQSGSSGKEGIMEVEEVASKRRRLSPISTTVQHVDHSTKLNIAADPFVPSSLPTVVTHHKSVGITAVNIATPTVAATPSHKTSIPTACYLPTAPMMHNMMPVIMPHPQLGSGYAISQQAAAYPSVFPATVPSHTYQMPTHPPSIVGLPYAAGYPMQQPTMLPSAAVTNNNVHNATNYGMFVPVTAPNVLPPAPPPSAAAVHHARVELRKKEEQIKALNDTKRFFEQNGSSVAKQPPQLGYKYPTLAVKPQLPVATEGGRRTLLENPPVAMAIPHLPMGSMMNRPLENTSPSTGSKRKRRPPLMPLPQIPAADNVTMVTPWDSPAIRCINN